MIGGASSIHDGVGWGGSWRRLGKGGEVLAGMEPAISGLMSSALDPVTHAISSKVNQFVRH